MTAPWAKAYEDHISLAKWVDGEVGKRNFAELFLATKDNPAAGFVPNRVAAVDTYNINRQALMGAPTFYATADMTALARHAAKVMKDEVSMSVEALSFHSGVLILDDRLSIPVVQIPDGKGDITFIPADEDTEGSVPLYVDVITWGLVTFPNGTLGLSAGIWKKKSSLVDAIERASGHRAVPGWLDHLPPWSFSKQVIWQEGVTLGEMRAGGSSSQFLLPLSDASMMSLVYSAIVLMGHKITRVGEASVPRSLARRGHREGVIPQVRCVTLRREAIGSHGDVDAISEKGQVNWSHRWLVPGYWGNHWYPSLGEHRYIFHAPHIKGPEDKPLVLKDTVYAWRR
jgi:hypothetical protein